MKHKWELSDKTSPSGKITYHYPICKLYDPAPVKDKYENRLCEENRYKDNWEVKNGKIYARL